MKIYKEGWSEGKFTRLDVRDAIAKLQQRNAAGAKGILNKHGYMENIGWKRILRPFNEIWKNGIHEEWRKGIIYPIFKKVIRIKQKIIGRLS